MKYVHIVSYDPVAGKGVQKVTCVLEDGSRVVECQGDEGVITELRFGVSHPTQMKKLTMDDGEEFLKALQWLYKHPSLLATEMIEADVVEPYVFPERKSLE